MSEAQNWMLTDVGQEFVRLTANNADVPNISAIRKLMEEHGIRLDQPLIPNEKRHWTVAGRLLESKHQAVRELAYPFVDMPEIEQQISSKRWDIADEMIRAYMGLHPQEALEKSTILAQYAIAAALDNAFMAIITAEQEAGHQPLQKEPYTQWYRQYGYKRQGSWRSYNNSRTKSMQSLFSERNIRAYPEVWQVLMDSLPEKWNAASLNVAFPMRKCDVLDLTFIREHATPSPEVSVAGRLAVEERGR